MNKRLIKGLQGITGKLMSIVFGMFLLFFIIVILLQVIISGYSIISKTEESLNDRRIKTHEIKSSEVIENIDEYNVQAKDFLLQLRNSISDENVVCEFVIVNKSGNIVCALRNEVIVYTFTDQKPKFARFEELGDNELYSCVTNLREQVKNLSIMPELMILGDGVPESYIDNTYNAISAFSLRTEEMVCVDISGSEYVLENDIKLKELRGKYMNEYISGKYTSRSYQLNTNKNRKLLIQAVSDGENFDKNEQKGLMSTVFYDTINLNNDYDLIMRTQVNPIEVAFFNSASVYLVLTVLVLVFSVILALIFSRMTVKPVRKIEEKARKLAALDFSNNLDYEYTRNDEIGSLYESINSLAINLDDAITQLKVKNRELTDDIEKERQMDSRRREFVASTSHELKTPLARIRGYAEALNLNLSEDKKDYYCQSLMSEVDIMNALILEMLSLSKLELQKYDEIDKTDIDLSEITERVTERCKKLIEDKKIKLEISAKHKEVKCLAEETKIERVITNFVDNAIHYTNEGGEIYIRLEERDGKACFEIENEGNHIDEAMIPYIWESFYKVDKSRTKKEEAKIFTAERTGLGLSIVRAILNLHKAEYGVKNTKIGVLFYFKI